MIRPALVKLENGPEWASDLATESREEHESPG